MRCVVLCSLYEEPPKRGKNVKIEYEAYVLVSIRHVRGFDWLTWFQHCNGLANDTTSNYRFYNDTCRNALFLSSVRVARLLPRSSLVQVYVEKPRLMTCSYQSKLYRGRCPAYNIFTSKTIKFFLRSGPCLDLTNGKRSF